MHLDRGYDNSIVRALCAELGLDDLILAKKRKAGKVKVAVSLGMRWPVERTNSWFSNFGQLRRNPDRFIHHRLDSIALAISLIIAIKLIKWAVDQRWLHDLPALAPSVRSHRHHDRLINVVNRDPSTTLRVHPHAFSHTLVFSTPSAVLSDSSLRQRETWESDGVHPLLGPKLTHRYSRSAPY